MNIFTDEQQYKIVELYKNGTNIDEIISMFDSCEHDIRTILKSNKIDRSYNNFYSELCARIVKLYQDKFTQKEICHRLLISEQGIRNTLKRNNIKMRSYSECNRKYFLNENYFDNIDTQNKAYLLGMLYADGCNHLEHYSITLSLQECDYDVVNFMKNELEYDGKIMFIDMKRKCNKWNNQYKLCINNEHMSKKLNELGVVNAKSLLLKFPKWLDESLYPHFIRGYFDGDGCIYYNEKMKKCTTDLVGTKNMCENISEILSNLGIKNHIDHNKNWGDNTFSVRTSGNKSSLSFLSWMYDNVEFCMERKYQKYLYVKEKYLANQNNKLN